MARSRSTIQSETGLELKNMFSFFANRTIVDNYVFLRRASSDQIIAKREMILVFSGIILPRHIGT
jgi:hypothetical protein